MHGGQLAATPNVKWTGPVSRTQSAQCGAVDSIGSSVTTLQTSAVRCRSDRLASLNGTPILGRMAVPNSSSSFGRSASFLAGLPKSGLYRVTSRLTPSGAPFSSNFLAMVVWIWAV